jgi:hypothetical protein
MDWGHGHPKAHMQGQTSGEQDGRRGVRIFDSADSNFENVEKFDANSNWQIGIRLARIVVVQNLFMNNSKARSNIR